MIHKFFKLVIIILLFAAPVLATDNSKSSTDKQVNSTKNPFNQVKFTPGISLILDLAYVRRNISDELLQSLEVPGYRFENHSHGHDHGGSGPGAIGENGFNLNYGELVLFASVDPYFDMLASFHLSEDSFEIEEAYVTTRKMPFGLGLKVGKFLSGFGRINSQHGHFQDFTDQPLVITAFLGSEGMADIGAQLNWTAPLDFYLNLGVETLQGSNSKNFSTEGFHVVDHNTEEELEVEAPVKPNLWTGFIKSSMETGDLVMLAGLSYATGKTRINLLEEEHDAYGFSGKTNIFGIDFYAKYIIDSYRYVTVQFEYLRRGMTGSIYEPEGEHGEDGEHDEHEEHNHEVPEVSIHGFESRQSGLYGQIVWRFHNRWRVGARWDSLLKNSHLKEGQDLALPQNLNRYSIMIDHNPTEFSKIRFQYSINRFAYMEAERKNYSQFVLQLNLAIGAHGAHPF